MKQSGNTILVTGGGSGIGRALAQQWHDRGNAVIITGRRRAALEETAGGRPRMGLYTLDVEDAGAIGAFARRVVVEHPALNVLVNNAGIIRGESLTAARSLDDAEQTIATNLLGPIRLTNALIDHLMTRPDAAIVNVSSGLGFVPLPAAPTYSATKAAIHSYTASLRIRLKGRVEVVELIPPAVRTGLAREQPGVDAHMPLDAFIGEVMALFDREPTPEEICVERVGFTRRAEAEGRFGQVLAMLDGTRVTGDV